MASFVKSGWLDAFAIATVGCAGVLTWHVTFVDPPRLAPGRRPEMWGGGDPLLWVRVRDSLHTFPLGVVLIGVGCGLATIGLGFTLQGAFTPLGFVLLCASALQVVAGFVMLKAKLGRQP